MAATLSVKRLQLLRELSPNLKRIAILWNANDLAMTLRYQATVDSAKALGVAVQSLGVREPDDFAAAFQAMAAAPPDAVMMVSDSLTILNRAKVLAFAAARRLPAMFEYKRYPREGGLISYGPDQKETAEFAVDFLDRILKGTKPSDVPVEQPAHFELVVNLKTANAVGISVPRSILARADEVIE